MSTGLIEGWQRFEDEWRSDVPLLPAGRWVDALSAADFSDVATLPRDGAPGDVLLQNVIVARASGDEVAAATTGPELHTASPGETTSTVAVPTAADIGEQLAEAMSDERHDIFVDAVRRAVAHVLRSSEADTLRRDQPLLDLGFDSLMAVELRNVLRQAFGLETKLPATLAFDHPTIDAIATFIGRLVGAGTLDDSAGRQPDRRAPGPDAVGRSQLEDLSEDEVEAALLDRLTEIE